MYMGMFWLWMGVGWGDERLSYIGETGAASCATTKRTGQDKLNGSGDTDYADC